MIDLINIIHLDDEPFELERLSQALKGDWQNVKFNVTSVHSVEKFQEKLAGEIKPDLVILDIHIDQALRGGVSLVDWTKKQHPQVVVLMCSALDDVSTISECLLIGADDFLSKNSDKKELPFRIHQSFQLAKLKRGMFGTSPTTPHAKKPDFVGNTFEKIAHRVPNILQSAISAVHVQGESGTGKEMVADLFSFYLGEKGPFLRVNCGAITPTLLESELFGHVKGAFTGAINDKKGLIETASGGWIFLDEVSSLSSSAQVALLRVLENQELIRVGSSKPIPIHVRILSATNDPLPELVEKGRFRKDLWQRLCEAEIQLVPLRERKEEIIALVKHFCKIMPGGPYQITEPALEVLINFQWKAGNIRELRNCLRAMTELHVNKLLTPLSIPERIWKQMEESGNDVESTTVDHVDRVALCGTEARLLEDITISVDPTKPIDFDELADKLLLELTRKISSRNGRLSLRQLAKMINISRSTLSTRFRGLVEKKIIPFEELTHLIGLVQK